MRQVIVHYHVFKNAGSTVDSMLENTFGKAWVEHDRDRAAALITPAELGTFIQAHPKLRAVSSHHAVLPPPDLPDVAVVPVVFLRHPLDRARSVYDFERRQGQLSGPVSKGAEHAARLSFRDYIRWRLDARVNGAVHNFQTLRAIFDRRLTRHPIEDADFEAAWARVGALPFFGLVEEFHASIGLLGKVLHTRGIELKTDYVARNQSRRETSLEERLERVRAELGEEMWEELRARNERDMELYARAEKEFRARVAAARG